MLFGFYFSEEFGYFHDTPESTDQTVEQVLSCLVDRVVYRWDELPVRPVSYGFMGSAMVDCRQPTQFIHSILLVSEYHGPINRPKLFQLLSTYRI